MQEEKMQTDFVALVTIYGEFLGDVSRSELEAYLEENRLTLVDHQYGDIVVVM
jgi:hypothetical protein